MTDSDQRLNPAKHRTDHRYLLRNNTWASVNEGTLVEWSKQGNARIRWANSKDTTYWILKDDLPEVVEDLGLVGRVTLKEMK